MPITVTTDLPSPTSFSIDDDSGGQFDLSWVDNSNNEDGFEIQVATDGGSYSVVTTVNPNTTSTTISKPSYTDSYNVRTVVYTEHVEESSNTVGKTIARFETASADYISNSALSDLFKDGIGVYSAEYDSAKEAFVTEWIHEEPIRDASEMSVRLLSEVETGPIRIAVERDDSGDGAVNARSEWVQSQGGSIPTRIPDIGNGDAQYRVLIRGADVAFDDFITGLDIGFTHR